jgi:hypothetical protein
LIPARLLDAVQTFAAIERSSAIKFAIGKRLMSVDLKQAFPGELYLLGSSHSPLISDFQPHCLADIYALSDLPITSSRNSTNSSRLSPVPPVHNATVIFDNNNQEDSFQPIDMAISPPHSAQLLGFNERSNSQTGLLGMNMAAAAKNRGRRVSFGAIHAINERKELHQFESAGLATSAKINLKKNHQSEGSLAGGLVHNNSVNPSPAISQSSVNEYVDKMLQKTFDKVLVME